MGIYFYGGAIIGVAYNRAQCLWLYAGTDCKAGKGMAGAVGRLTGDAQRGKRLSKIPLPEIISCTIPLVARDQEIAFSHAPKVLQVREGFRQDGYSTVFASFGLAASD